MQSTTPIDAELSELLDGDHVVLVHLSYEEPQVYIACGDVGGWPDANGNVFFGLQGIDGFGVAGVAWFHDNGDGTTTVTIFFTLTDQVA